MGAPLLLLRGVLDAQLLDQFHNFFLLWEGDGFFRAGIGAAHTIFFSWPRRHAPTG